MTEHSSQSAMKIRCPGCGHKLDVSELAPLSLHPCPRCWVEFRVPKWFQSTLLEDVLHEEQSLQVYRALDTTLDREVCVKLIVGGGRFSEEQLDAFLAVTRRMAAIAHPQVASIYACGRSDDGAAYVVQQYVPTMSYAEIKEQMEPALLQRYGLCIIGALMAADAIGICHGGLGPGNILFDKDNFVRVTDFGVARALGKDAGADPYASPDVRSGAPASMAGDLYSLAVILYELATGRRPVEARTPLHVSHPNYSQAFGECLERMFSERPEDRPDSYAEIFSILDGKILAKQGPGRIFRYGGAHAAGGRRPGSLVSPVATPVQRSAPRRGSNIVNILLLCAFLALCAVFLAYCLQQRRTDVPLGMMLPSLTTSKAVATGGIPGEQRDVAGGNREVESGVAVIAPAVWASRPRPPDLDFKATREENKRYLEAVPATLQETERDRLRILGLARDYLQQTMRYIGYDRGENGRIMLRDGRSYPGTIPRANEKGLTIRRRDLAEADAEDSMQVGFADLAWPQIWDIFAFYAEKRLDMAVNKRQERAAERDSFDNYLQLALLCDWYGFPEDSRRYAGMAVAAQPGKEYLLRKYGLTAAPR